MLFVTYWMAARFASVVHRLEAMYRDSLARDNDGDKAYFTNIDPSGEKGKRPPLLLPPPEELQSTMRSALWLGRQIQTPNGGGSLIQESDGRVVLIQETKDGIDPFVIGESISALGDAADIVTIYRVTDAVTAAASSLEADQAEALRVKLRSEDAARAQEHGPATSQYAAWVQERKQIHDLLNR